MEIKNFEIKSIVNGNIYQTGYVEIPDDVEEEAEWFYTNQSGLSQAREFTHHDDIGLSQIGATEEQEFEIEEFLNEVHQEWVTDIILTFDKGTYEKGDLVVTID